MSKTPSQILSDAADLIERYGWLRGSYGSEQLGFCALGALYSAAGTDPANPDWNPNRGEARARLRKFIGPSAALSFWNDYVAVSQREVVETFRKAAADEEEIIPDSQ